jgi:hydroxymethylbilane synthase|tara:strand:- start:206 stop:1129 length:924 start_codon:yes stop_codon:yes gene_type:complete
MKSKKIIIGSRSSKLALIYAEIAKNKIFEFKSDFRIENIDIKKITTKGDEVQNVRLSDIGGKGLFSKKIEEQLLEKKIDIAVHALKDMPCNDTEGLITNCFLERNDPREILISGEKKKLRELKTNSVIGTSSFRREFQLKKIRSDLNYKLIRGNVDTRLEKLNNKIYDAIILSYAGIKSLGLDKNISEIFSTSDIIPSAGQGVIALQCRKEDREIINLLKKINHQPTNYCVQAERNVLKILDGNCETAVGAHAEINKDKINIEAELFSLDGKERFYLKSSKDLNLASQLGKEVGEILKKQSNNSYKK